MVFILLLGIGVLAYPFARDTLNDYLAQELIASYQKKANEKNAQETEKIKAKMAEENKALAEKNGTPGLTDFNQAVDEKNAQNVTTDFLAQHTIGSITIPKISIDLPIFDTTSEIFLQKGITLLQGSSYPTGGESTHAVLSGHRGLAEAKLFTDLPDLKIGDEFYLTVNKETLAYEVEAIKVVKPDETESLKIQPGRDLVTLLTCTPYMVNSHRLLVTGHRVPYVKAAEKKVLETKNKKEYKFIFWLLGSLLGLILLFLFFYHLLRYLGIRKNSYGLSLKVVDNEGKPLLVTGKLLTKNGKKNLKRNGQSLILTTNDQGIMAMDDLKGGHYQLKVGDVSLELKIKKVQDNAFTLSLKKAGKGILTKEEKDYLLKML